MPKVTATYALIAMLVQILALPQAGAATFNYTSHLYSTNDDPNLFGSNLTASVSLSCTNVCADGIYNGAQITDLFLQSGTLSLDIHDANVLVEFAGVHFVNGQITEWALSLYTAGGVNINSANGSPGSLVLDAAVVHGVGAAYNFNSPDTWSGPVLVGAPGPITGTGLLPLLASLVGFLFWRRHRNPIRCFD